MGQAAQPQGCGEGSEIQSVGASSKHHSQGKTQPSKPQRRQQRLEGRVARKSKQGRNVATRVQAAGSMRVVRNGLKGERMRDAQGRVQVAACFNVVLFGWEPMASPLHCHRTFLVLLSATRLGHSDATAGSEPRGSASCCRQQSGTGRKLCFLVGNRLSKLKIPASTSTLRFHLQASCIFLHDASMPPLGLMRSAGSSMSPQLLCTGGTCVTDIMKRVQSSVPSGDHYCPQS